MKLQTDCTGDVVVGDTIKFTEGVFGGSYSKPSHSGDRTITAKVLKESYGGDKQQHTFSLQVIESSGFDPVEAGKKIRRKGRNIYRNGTFRMEWEDEARRGLAADEKHERGDSARKDRDARREEAPWYDKKSPNPRTKI